MAEIRKYDPAKGNAIAEALRAAMGDPIRPVAPGERPEPRQAQPDQTASTAWISLQISSSDDAGDAT